MVIKNIFLISLFIFASFSSFYSEAQKVDTVAAYSISGYLDVYAASYTDSVGAGNFQKFPTASPRSNSVGLNIFQLTSKYDGEKMRGMAVLHFGDIPQSTWAKTNNYVEEAHVGFRVRKNLWVDGGFFRTYFGTEYLLPVENITSSVSVATYYELYYLAGLRLDYFPTQKLEVALYLMNGYGIYEDNNNKKSLGLALTYNANDNVCIGYTNYIGDDAPDSAHISQFRMAHNVYINYHYRKIKLQAGGDIYTQEHADISDNTKSANAYNALLTLGYQTTPKFEVYGRGEIFQDANGLLSGVITDAQNKLTGYKLWGATLGIEYKPTDNSYIRLEGRKLQMDQAQEIFRYNGENRNYRYEIMLNAGISFSLLKGFKTSN